MGQIETTIDRDADLTVRTVAGEVTAEELLDALATYRAGEVTRYILWDCHEASWDRLTGSEVRSIAQAALGHSGRRPGGRTALLVSSAAAFGMARMIDQSLSASDSPVEFQTFYDRAAAMAWLGVSTTHSG